MILCKLRGAVFLSRTSLCIAAATAGLQAQLLYNSARDARSQEAVKAAKEVTNGQVFNSMQSNVDRLAKASSDRFFAGAERQMKANLSSFVTWKQLREYLNKLDTRLHADFPGDATDEQVKSATDQLKAAIENARQALDEAKAAAKKQFGAQDDINQVGAWFGRLGQFGEIEGLASRFSDLSSKAPASYPAAAAEAATLTASLAKMYTGLKISLPQTPDLIVLQAQLDLLRVNENHLKQIAAITLRREGDLADTYSLLHRTNRQLDYLTLPTGPKTGTCATPGHYPNLDTPIADTLRNVVAKLKTAPAKDKPTVRCDLDIIVFSLYNASALAARDDSARRLAGLRLAEEERRYSIRASAVSARSYETLVATGTQRLANYYKGGVKPETLAQMASALATLGLIPTIAVK